MDKGNVFVAIFIAFCVIDHTTVTAKSCVGRCEESYKYTDPCQCDEGCPYFANCCDDMFVACNRTASCSVDCEALKPDKKACFECAMVKDVCVSDDQLLEFTSALWKLTKNYVNTGDVKVDPNGEKYFVSLNEEILKEESFVKTEEIFKNNYARNDEYPESATNGRKSEIAFIHHFLNTETGKLLYNFLRNKGLSGCGRVFEFKNILKVLWSEKYGRKVCKTTCSNGFENVFVGELKGTGKGFSRNKWIRESELEQYYEDVYTRLTPKGDGFGMNNWLQMYRLEKSSEIKLKHLNTTLPSTTHQTIEYNFKGSVGTSTVFVGASPDWEFAVYTLCHIVRADRADFLVFLALQSIPALARCTIMAQDWIGNEYKVTIKSQAFYARPPKILHNISRVQVLN